MRIVAGLGNPGPRYARTRHNVGFMVIDHLASRWRVELGPPLDGLRVAKRETDGQAVALVQPQSYMNLSGPALARLDSPWTVDDLIVVYDDIDLLAGQLRVRRGGGAGGHRGVASVIETWGPEFERVRVGVGRPGPDGDAAEYVLAELARDELDSLRESAARGADAVECLLSEGIGPTMNRFNVRPAAPVT